MLYARSCARIPTRLAFNHQPVPAETCSPLTDLVVQGWAADITRTWPCSGTYTVPQKAIYDTVLAAQQACVAKCVPGQSMTTATEASNRKLIEGLLGSASSIFFATPDEGAAPALSLLERQ